MAEYDRRTLPAQSREEKEAIKEALLSDANEGIHYGLHRETLDALASAFVDNNRIIR